MEKRICKYWGYSFIKEKGKWKREHVVVMEQSLGRRLIKGEIVHHIDGDKLNNSIDNLILTNRSEHQRLHHSGSKRSKETKQKISESAKERNMRPDYNNMLSERAKKQHSEGKLGRKRIRPIEEKAPYLGSNRKNSKLVDSDIIEIRDLYKHKVYDQYELAKIYGVTQGVIGSVIRRETWKHVK